MAALPEFAARHSPWLGPPASESWLDLSGAPTCAPDFLRARAMRAARHGATGSRLLSHRHGCGAARQMDRISLSWRHGLRLGAELAADEAAAATVAAAVRPRPRRCRRHAHSDWYREGEGATA